MPHLLPNQSTDQAIEAIFGPVLEGSKGFNFFSYCLCARSPSLGEQMREQAGQRIAEKLGEELPPWVKEDTTALHLYACRLGGVAVHEKVERARAACGDGFYEEVAEAVGALLYYSSSSSPLHAAAAAGQSCHHRRSSSSLKSLFADGLLLLLLLMLLMMLPPH